MIRNRRGRQDVQTPETCDRVTAGTGTVVEIQEVARVGVVPELAIAVGAALAAVQQNLGIGLDPAAQIKGTVRKDRVAGRFRNDRLIGRIGAEVVGHGPRRVVVVDQIEARRRGRIGRGNRRIGRAGRNVAAEVAVIVELEPPGAAREVGAVDIDLAPGEIRALRLARARVDAVGADIGAGLEDILVAADQIVTLAGGQLLLPIIVGRQIEVTAVEGRAPGRGGVVLFAAAFQRNGAEHVELATIAATTRDQVHHPGHGVRTIDGRGTVLQHVDTVDRRLRNNVQVEGGDTAARAGRPRPAAVQQDEGAIGPEAAERNGRRTRSAVGHKGAGDGRVDLGRTGRQGRGLQQLGGIAEAALLRAIGGQDLDRRGAVELGHRDARPRNDDVIDLRSLRIHLALGLLGLGLWRRGLRRGETGSEQEQDGEGTTGEAGRGAKRVAIKHGTDLGLTGTIWRPERWIIARTVCHRMTGAETCPVGIGDTRLAIKVQLRHICNIFATPRRLARVRGMRSNNAPSQSECVFSVTRKAKARRNARSSLTTGFWGKRLPLPQTKLSPSGYKHAQT